MKIYANIEVININQALSGIRKNGKASKSILFLCKNDASSKSQTYLMLATKKDPSGNKYKVMDNLDSVFTKFIEEGKCTIRLKEPPLDFKISKADPIQLKGFLKVLKLCCDNKLPENITLQNIASINVLNKEFCSEPTKMIIKSRLNYPVTEIFPQSLTDLIINGIKLISIDSRIFTLKKLTHLNLSDNSISELPDVSDGWNNLAKLDTLILSKNNISNIPHNLLTSCLNKNLNVLDLSYNNISLFPIPLLNFKSLIFLKLSGNKISLIPNEIRKDSFRRMKLYLDENLLTHLPGEFLDYMFDTLDISNNSFKQDEILGTLETDTEHLISGVMTLMEIVARTIRFNNIIYTLNDVSILKPYLDCGRKCNKCKKYIFESIRKSLIKGSMKMKCETYSGPDWCLFEEIICSYCERLRNYLYNTCITIRSN